MLGEQKIRSSTIQLLQVVEFKGTSFLKKTTHVFVRTWTPPKPFGPRKRSHSAAMSAQRHSNRWTMAVLPCLVWGLCWARLSPNRATRMKSFMLSLKQKKTTFTLSLSVSIYTKFFFHPSGPMRSWQISAWRLNRCILSHFPASKQAAEILQKQKTLNHEVHMSSKHEEQVVFKTEKQLQWFLM